MSALYNKVTIQGTFTGGESWSVNPCFGEDASGGGAITTFEDLQEWATSIIGLQDNAVLPDSLLTALSTLGLITGVRTAVYTAAGVLQEAAEATITNGVAGTGAATKPFQTSIVSSLDTGRPGRSYAGRLYWPAMGEPIDTSTARLQASQTQTLATDVANWLESVAAAAPAAASLFPVVVSHKLAVQTPITRVRVGDVFDTQRRRRDSLVEVYASATVS